MPRIIAVFIVALLTAPALGGHDGEKAKPAVVPFAMLPSNHMVVEVKLNEKGPYRLIFDLGSPVTLLANKPAETAGAIPAGAPRSFLFGTRGEGRLKKLEAGALTAEDIP